MCGLNLFSAESSLLSQLTCCRDWERLSTGTELLSLGPVYPRLRAGSQAHREGADPQKLRPRVAPVSLSFPRLQGNLVWWA